MSSASPAWLLAGAVFVGSGLGGVGRWAAGLLLKRLGAGWPAPLAGLAGTWIVNVLGSAILAALVMRGHRGGLGHEPLRLLLTTGAMGGFTTYSTFNTEMVALMSEGRWPTALGYLCATVGGCLAGGWLAFR